MAGTQVPSTPAEGKVKTVVVPTVANLSAITVAEANAVSAVDISCYLTLGGWAATTDQGTIADDRECDTQTRNEPGRKNHSLTITGIDNTNTPYESTDNDLVDAMEEGVEKIVLRRWGKDHTAAFAAGDTVRVYVFKPGFRQEVALEQNSVQRSMWPAFVSYVGDVELTAS